MRSIHGRHNGESTAPSDQCARDMTLQAVDTAPVRSYAILNSLLITLTPPWNLLSRVVAVNGEIATWAPQRQTNGSVGPVRPWHESPGRRHRASALMCDSELAAHHPHTTLLSAKFVNARQQH